MSRDPSFAHRCRDHTGGASEDLGNRPSARRRPDGAGAGVTAAVSPPRYNLSLGALVLSLIWLGPILACGSFQPRPTPTAQSLIAAPAQGDPTPAQPLPTAAPTDLPAPTATTIPPPTPTVVIRHALNIGDQARISASAGLNIREQPSAGAPFVVLLAQGKRVLVLEGPTVSEGYVWWKVDDNQGNIGWVAGSRGAEAWISPQLGEARPINRSPIVGDRVVVTLVGELSVRALPGVSSALVARARTDEQFSVVAGPQAADNYFWYQIRSDDGEVEGWAADGRDGERWLSPLE